MTTATLKHLLSHVKKQKSTRINDVYQSVLENALARQDTLSYAPELAQLLAKYPL